MPRIPGDDAMFIAPWLIDVRFGIKDGFDLEVEILQELQDKWDERVKSGARAKFSEEMEPLVVPSSSHWEIFRSVDLKD